MRKLNRDVNALNAATVIPKTKKNSHCDEVAAMVKFY